MQTLKPGRISIYLFFLVLGGLALRVYNLGKSGFWFDEASILNITNRFKEHFFFVALDDTVGRLFMALLRAWMCVASGEFALRFFSVIWGTLSIILIYRLGKFLFSKEIGILAALFLSLSPLHIYYSQELTGYSLSVFLALASTYYLFRFLESPKRIFPILYVISTAGFIYTHPINLVFVLVQNVFFYVFYNKDKPLQKKWLYTQLAIFLLFSPWLTIVILRFLRFSQLNTFFWIPKPDLTTLLQTFLVFSLGYNASCKLQSVALIIFACLLIRAFYNRNLKKEVYYLIFWLALPIIVIWIISQFYPFYLYRILLFALPAFYLLASTGLVRFKKYLRICVIGCYLILVTFSLRNYYENQFPSDYLKRYTAIFPKKDYKQAAYYVGKNFRDGDIIFHICRSSLFPFVYYHQNKFPERGVCVNGICKEDWFLIWGKLYQDYSLGITQGRLKVFKIERKEDLRNYKRIWLIQSAWHYQGRVGLSNCESVDREIIDWFDRNFQREETQMFNGINIYLFTAKKE